MTTKIKNVLKRLRRSEKRRKLKNKNDIKRLWYLIYSRIRTVRVIESDSPYINPIARKFAVLANRIYVRRNNNG